MQASQVETNFALAIQFKGALYKPPRPLMPVCLGLPFGRIKVGFRRVRFFRLIKMLGMEDWVIAPEPCRRAAMQFRSLGPEQ